MRRTVLFISAVAALAGCETTKSSRSLYGYTKERPLTEVMQPVRLAGTGGPTQVPGTVKAYAIRRWIDPVNHRVLHEAGVVYRQEEDPRWNLQPANHLPPGPYGRRDPHYFPRRYSQEWPGELQRQRQVTEALERKVDQLQASQSDPSALLEATRKVEQNQRDLGQKLDAMTAEGQKIQQTIESAKAQEMKRPPGTAADPSTP
jgi:hypothetical protein